MSKLWKGYDETTDDEALQKAADLDKQSRRNALFALAGEQISSGFSRTKANDSLYKHLMGTADRADQVRARRGDVDAENMSTFQKSKFGEGFDPTTDEANSLRNMMVMQETDPAKKKALQESLGGMSFQQMKGSGLGTPGSKGVDERWKTEFMDVGGRHGLFRFNPATKDMEEITFKGQPVAKAYTKGVLESPDGLKYSQSKNTGLPEQIITPGMTGMSAPGAMSGTPQSAAQSGPMSSQQPGPSVGGGEQAPVFDPSRETPVQFDARVKEYNKRRGEMAKNQVGSFKDLADTRAALTRLRSRNRDFEKMYDEAAKEPTKFPLPSELGGGIELPFLDGTGMIGGRVKEFGAALGASPGKISSRLIKETQAEANQYIKEITGAQMSEPEAKRLGFEMPKIWQDRESFIETMNANEKKYERLLLQRQHLFQLLGPEEYQKRMMLVQTNPSTDPFAGVDMDKINAAVDAELAAVEAESPEDTSKESVADQGEQQVQQQAAQPTMVKVQLPSGQVGSIPESNVEQFLQDNEGAKVVQ